MVEGKLRLLLRGTCAAALLLSTACGGGSGGGAAAGVTAEFGLVGSQSPETAGSVELEIVLRMPPGVLLEPVEFGIVDTGGGTATFAVDYEELPSSTVVFQAGAQDGDVRSVTWTPIDDGVSEGNETLSLQIVELTHDPARVVASGVVTILDDESSTLLVAQGARDGAFVVNGGALDVGNQTIGIPTDVGVDVWLDNIGIAPLRVSAPVLVSGSIEDFEIELAAGATAGARGEADVLPFPLAALGAAALSGDSVTSSPLAPSPELLALLRPAAHVVLVGVPVPGSLPLDLELERVPLPVRPGAVLAVDGALETGGIERLVGDLTLWSGHVVGDEDAAAFLSFSEHGSRGWIATSSASEDALHLVPSRGNVGLSTLAFGAGLAAARTEVCSGVREVPGREAAPLTSPATEAGDRLTPYTCRLALETDHAFFAHFGDATALATYVTQLVGALSDRFGTDVGTRFELAYLGLHTTSNDPWSTPDAGGDVEDLLVEFQRAWGPLFGGAWPVQADLAHLLSGAPIGGGIAFVDALCDPNFGFGVSASLNGLADWSSYSVESSAMYWDFDVLAHEIGHGFAARHTHEYCPPLDTCGLSCMGQLCERGTIMSYCHACPGGVANVDLVFHPLTANEMRRAANRSPLARSVLAPGEASSFRVYFRPVGPSGRRRATLEFAHDALSSASPYRIELQGMAEAAGQPADLPLSPIQIELPDLP